MAELVFNLGVFQNHGSFKTCQKAPSLPLLNAIEHIGRLVRMSVLDTEVDGSNPGSSMLFP